MLGELLMAEPVTDLPSELRAAANRWTMLARDYARQGKALDAEDPRKQYFAGLAEGYYKAALELAGLLKGSADLPVAAPPAAPAQTAPPPAQTAPPAPAPAAAPPAYLTLPLGEVTSILAYAGTNPRDVVFNRASNTYMAVFSRWENLMPHERLEKIRAADFRIEIVSSGKTRDSGDPFVELAFRP